KRQSGRLQHHWTGILRAGIFSLTSFGRWKRIRCGILSRIEPRPNQSEALDRVKNDVAAAKADDPNTPVPVDLITTSSSAGPGYYSRRSIVPGTTNLTYPWCQ